MKLKNKRVLTVVSADYDDLELFYPILRLREAGVQVDVAAEKAKTTYKGKYGLSVESDLSFADVVISDYDGLLIPGGWAPDYLRRLDDVLGFVRYMDEHKRVIGIICHAGWVLASADILRGVHVTSTPGIKHDLIHAGAKWDDRGALADGHIISGRRPPDLPEYLPLIMDALQQYGR